MPKLYFLKIFLCVLLFIANNSWAANNTERQNENMIVFPVIEFDPLKTGEPDLSYLVAEKQSISMKKSNRNYYIVQFKDTIQGAWQKDLMGSGAEIFWYIPHNARLISISPESLYHVKMHSAVRWIGKYQPAMKIRPEFLDEISSGQMKPSPGSEIAKRLSILLFRNEDMESFVNGLTKKYPGVRILLQHKAKDFNIVEVEVAVRQAPELIFASANTEGVYWIDARKHLRPFNDTSIQTIQNGPGGGTPIWDTRGIMGQGQVVAVSDSGLDDDMCFFRHDSGSGPLLTQYIAMPNAVSIDSTQRKVIAYNTAPGAGEPYDHDACYGHGTHVSGSIAGDNFATLPSDTPPYSGGHDLGDGMAPMAKIFFEDIGYTYPTSLGYYEECRLSFPSLYDLLAQERNSADNIRISSNSWGDINRTYTQLSLESDSFQWDNPDFTVLYAMGNSGYMTGCTGIGDPATAKNCISVAAVDNSNSGITDYSSPGPPVDNRIKPDIACPGGDLMTERINSAYADESIYTNNCFTQAMQGTSMAAPTCAGGIAMVRQYFTDGWYPSGTQNPTDAFTPSAALVKAVTINGGYNIPGNFSGSYFPGCPNVMEDAPAKGQGWGMMHLENSLYFESDIKKMIIWDINNAGGVATGQQHLYGFTVNSNSVPLKITLVWTDPPSTLYCMPCLVDNLDLEAAAPSGNYYRGNQFTASPGKESAPNPAGTDTLNNVEGILVNNPVTGDWSVTVNGTNVPGKPPVITQGYALVVTGDVIVSTACTAPQFGGVQSVLDINAGANNGIRINWQQPANWGQGATSGTYDLRRYEDSSCSAAFTPIATSLPATTTAYDDLTAIPGLTYYYQIIATNNCSIPMSTTGTNSCSSAIVDDADFTPCPDVGNTLQVSKSGANALLTWTAVNCADFAWYRVYASASYSTPFPGAWTILGAPTGTAFANSLSSSYIAYKIISVDACGNLSPN